MKIKIEINFDVDKIDFTDNLRSIKDYEIDSVPKFKELLGGLFPRNENMTIGITTS